MRAASPFLYDEGGEDYLGFWAEQAAALLDWDEDWHTILKLEAPFAEWFVGGKLNACFNAVDRHVIAGNGDKVRSEEHTSELQSLMRISSSVFCLKKKY